MYDQLAVMATFLYGSLADSAPNFQGFGDINMIFIVLFQVFLVLILFFILVGSILFMADFFTGGASTNKLRDIFKLF